MSEVLDRSPLAAGLEAAGIAWKELDAAERKGYAVDGVEPRAICWPASYDEAARALALADRLGLAASPRGAGTKVGLGNPPRAVDLVISTEKLNQIVEYAPANLTLSVQAGVRLADLNATLARHGQFLPLDPPWSDRATVGGIVAANASGPLRLGYGSARDLVIGTKAATTGGTVVKAGGRVVKNVAGYDLNKLYVGSLGTLVLLVELGFKLAPWPAGQATVVGHFSELGPAGEATRRVLRSPLLPAALDLLNGPAAASLGESPVAGFRGGYVLAARGMAGGGGLVRQRDGLARIFREAGAREVVDLADAASGRLWEQIAARPARACASGGVRAKVAVPIGEGPRVVAAIEGRPLRGVAAAVGGQAGSGVYYATWDLPEPVADEQIAEAVAGLAALREAARGLGGSLVIEAAPRGIKERLDVWGDVGSSLPLIKRLKAALDPNGTLNPGRFVGGI